MPGTNESLTPERVSHTKACALRRARDWCARLRLTARMSSSHRSGSARWHAVGIELAAPRLRSMSVDELSQRLDQRFALPTDSSRTAPPPRHRTLRSTIDWSYDLLTDVSKPCCVEWWCMPVAGRFHARSRCAPPTGRKLRRQANDVTIDKSPVAATSRRSDTVSDAGDRALVRAGRLRDSGEESQWRSSHLALRRAGRGVQQGGHRNEAARMARPDRERARQPAGRARVVN